MHIFSLILFKIAFDRPMSVRVIFSIDFKHSLIAEELSGLTAIDSISDSFRGDKLLYKFCMGFILEENNLIIFLIL